MPVLDWQSPFRRLKSALTPLREHQGIPASRHPGIPASRHPGICSQKGLSACKEIRYPEACKAKRPTPQGGGVRAVAWIIKLIEIKKKTIIIIIGTYIYINIFLKLKDTRIQQSFFIIYLLMNLCFNIFFLVEDMLEAFAQQKELIFSSYTFNALCTKLLAAQYNTLKTANDCLYTILCKKK